MRLVDRVIVQTAVEETGIFNFEAIVQEGYRGRGETEDGFGIRIDDPSVAQEFFVQLAMLDSDIAMSLVRATKVDQLGKGYIQYFPGWGLTSV